MTDSVIETSAITNAGGAGELYLAVPQPGTYLVRVHDGRATWVEIPMDADVLRRSEYTLEQATQRFLIPAWSTLMYYLAHNTK